MRIQVYVPGWIDMKPEVVRRLARCEKESICVACDKPIAEGKKTVRGCHEYCHAVTMAKIESGLWTEAARISSGKLLAKATGGRKPSNSVSIEANGTSS